VGDQLTERQSYIWLNWLELEEHRVQQSPDQMFKKSLLRRLGIPQEYHCAVSRKLILNEGTVIAVRFYYALLNLI